MPCHACKRSIPEDSVFCPFCGEPIEAKHPDQPVAPTPIAPVAPPAKPQKIYAAQPKTVYCRQCGKPIDNETKKCTGCGKQYFRGIRPITFLCIVLVVAVLALAAIGVIQHIGYNKKIGELEEVISSYEEQL